MATPEGKVKVKISKYLKANDIWYTMITPSAFGSSTGVSDYICLKNKVFFSIEAKREDDKKGPTANQLAFMEKVRYNGGLAFLVRNSEDIAEMDKVLRANGIL